jgi:undecaprenyl-diphosphatase
VDIFSAIILSIIEGFTEFLPISSTGHMIVASKFLGVAQTEANKAFEVIIQLSAILAVIANYKDKFSLSHLNLWLKLFVAFLPIAIVGLLFSHQIKALFSVKVVAIMFIVGGVIFLIQEYFYKEDRVKVRDVEDVSYLQALVIGIFQVFAVIPGTSRAGSTIVGALLAGLDRKSAAEFSFLLAFPVMLAASGHDLLKHYHEFTNENLLALGVGFLVSFIVAFLTIKLFIKFLEKFTFVAFGIYRIVFGLVLLYILNFL